jgi:hypothetical protein
MDLNMFLDAIAQHHWPVVAGTVISFLVYVANRYGLKDKIGAKYVPWVAAGLGILSSIGTQLLSGGSNWQNSVSQGLAAGLAATGLWELILKNVLPAAAASTTPATPVTPPVTPPAPPPAPAPPAPPPNN